MNKEKIVETLTEIINLPYTKTMIVMMPMIFMHIFGSRDSVLILGVVIYAFFSLSNKIKEMEQVE